MKRLQHSGFGKELRRLLGSRDARDRELAGILVSEINELCRCRELGQRHSREDALEGRLSEIGYLRVYSRNQSARVYFTVMNETLWMLALDPAKRQKKLSSGMQERLKNRIQHIKREIKESAQ